jgi:hypothetical protein
MFFSKPMTPADFQNVSAAVQNWYRHFNVEPKARTTDVLCRAAIDVFCSGVTVDAIADELINRFPGPMFCRAMGPTSLSIH